MKRACTKLAVLAASAVVVALMAAALAFNLFIGNKVESDAVNDIEFLLDLNDDAVSTGRTPNYFLVDSAFRIDQYDRQWVTEDERALAKWFSAHPETGTVSKVTLDNWTCYAALVHAGNYTTYSNEPFDGGHYYDGERQQQDGYYIAFVDIASEEALISTVNSAFVIIGILGAFAAAAAGYIAGRRIDDANDAQKRFYENMSHDLKTPLAAIRGYAEGASRGVVDGVEANKAIVRETDRMTETINEILSLSRLESGGAQPSKELVEVEDFVQDCLMPLEGAIRTKCIDVELDLAAGQVMADPGLFDHAFSNVLTNAVRHAESCLRVTYDGARLSVWNDGEVPDSDRLSHMFDRFQAGEGGSTGIGLAIVKEVSTLHGWDVSAKAVDDGLEITFTF